MATLSASTRRHGRRVPRAVLLLICCWLPVSLSSCGLLDGPPPDKVSQLQWLSGEWNGELDGERIRMTWSQPANGMMEGQQETWRDGRIAVSAGMRILGGQGGIVLFGSPHGASDRNYGLVDGTARSVRFLSGRRAFPAEGTFSRSGDRLTVTFRGLDDVDDLMEVVYEYTLAEN